MIKHGGISHLAFLIIQVQINKHRNSGPIQIKYGLNGELSRIFLLEKREQSEISLR